ncbi:MAG TPA: LamG-like jellyroll fold domain-containing protein, partial [Candidatus Dormibacteraeota bacterium]
TLFGDDVYLPGLNLADGRTHHVVAALSGTRAQLTVDGATPNGLIWQGTTWSASAQPFALSLAPNTAPNPLWIGRSKSAIWNVGATYFQGMLDEVAIYDHVLTAARVQAHLTAGSAYRSTVLADTPTAYYRLDDRSATIADASGNGRQAAWNGAVTFGSAALVSGSGDTTMTFDGAGGFVQAPSLNPCFNTSPGTCVVPVETSAELWFSTSSQTQQQLLEGSCVGAQGQSLAIGLTQSGGVGGSPPVNTPGIYVTFWGDDIYVPGLNLGDGAPHQVVVTLDNARHVFVYVDGATPNGLVWQGSSWSGSQAQPFTVLVQPSRQDSPLWIGRSRCAIWGTGSNYFQGTLGEVSVYDGVLSGARVQAHRTAGPGYRAAVLADAPRAYYPLSERSGTIADSSGLGNAAAWNGGVSFGSPGLISGDTNTAMSFDGTSGFVQAPVLTPLQNGNTNSIELWFNTGSAAQQQILDAGCVGAQGQSYILGLTQNGGVGGNPPVNTPGVFLSFFADDVYLPGLNLGDGRPHQLVVTLSGTSVFIYLDGTTPSGLVWQGTTWSGSQVQPFTLPAAPSNPPAPLWIGRSRCALWGTGSTYFQGTVDEVSVYDHVLTGARVQAHLTAGAGYRSAVLADLPTAYYRLDE